MSYFPMMVKLDEKKVLIIGGGEEGLKKTRILHEFGAEITLISTLLFFLLMSVLKK